MGGDNRTVVRRYGAPQPFPGAWTAKWHLNSAGTASCDRYFDNLAASNLCLIVMDSNYQGLLVHRWG